MPESLDSTLGLNDTETQILLRLVTWDRLAREQVRAIATCGHRSVKIGSVNAIVRGLRKKLVKHKIKLVTVHGYSARKIAKEFSGCSPNLTPVPPPMAPPSH